MATLSYETACVMDKLKLGGARNDSTCYIELSIVYILRINSRKI